MKRGESSDIPFCSVVLNQNRLKTLTRDLCLFFCFFLIVIFPEEFQEKGQREANV